MLVDLIRWLMGYVTFSFSKGFGNDFLDDCFAKGVRLYRVYQGEDCLHACCSAAEYKRLHHIACCNGGVVRIEKRHGVIFSILALCKRRGLVAGALAFLVLVGLLGGFVWNVEIVGTDKLSPQQISIFLQEQGFGAGVYKGRVNKDAIEDMLMASFDDVAWVHINYFGSNARVEISEATPKPEIANEKGVANLKATRDGIIVKAMTYDGWQVARVGDSVAQGDLLVSGIYQGEKVNLYAHASGEFIAQVRDSFKVSVSRTQCHKTYTDTSTLHGVRFFGLYIPLYFGRVSTKSADTQVATDYLKLNGVNLPIGVSTITLHNYVVEESTLTDRQLQDLVKKRVAEYMSKSYDPKDVISKKYDVQINADDAVASCKVTSLQSIGEEVKVKIRKK